MTLNSSEAGAGHAGWRENYAYALGIQAYLFGFPWIFLPSIRWQWVTQPRNPELVPFAPLNRFWHARKLADARYRDGGSPNNDTLYSTAWLDVGPVPINLSHPDMGDRYFTFEIASMSSDNFAYVGKRTTGGRSGSFAIVGPHWAGKLPDDVHRLDSPTNSVLILGRTLVEGLDDVPNVHALQEQYSLTPLSLRGKPCATSGEASAWEPFDPKQDPLAEWQTLNKAMGEDRPIDQHAALLKQFATIGVGPGLDVSAMEEGTKRGLARAAVDGRRLVTQILEAGGSSKRVNGWSYPPPSFGRAGLHDDFTTRAAIQCLGGIISNDPEEVVYMNTFTDGTGERLSGRNRYVVHFKGGELPEVHAFWSMSMYDMTQNLVENPIERYSIGNRTKDLSMDADGGLRIVIQNARPAENEVVNWLPSPEGEFSLILRAYMPAAPIVSQTWRPPAVEKV